MTVKIRILHITQSVGGIETYIDMLLRYLEPAKFECSLICPDQEGTLAEKALSYDVPVHILPMVRSIKPWRDLRHYIEIKRLIRSIRPNIVHVHSSKAGVLGRMAASSIGIPCLYTPHAFAFLGRTGFTYWLFVSIERFMRPRTSRLVATSLSEANRATNEVGFSEDRVPIFSDSIEVEDYLHKEIPDNPNPPQVIMVGRLINQKNPEMFVRVAHRVRQHRPDVHFKIIGSGYQEFLREKVDAQIRELNFEQSLEIVPWLPRNELLDTLARTTVLAVPSRFESFGYVAAEAGMLQKPVVATNVDGLKDIIADGSSGILVDSNDDAAMAEKIVELLGNPALRKRMGQAGRKRVEEHFNITRNIRKIEAVYADVYEQRYGQSIAV